MSWKVAVLGVNAFGPGPATVSPDVMVTDTTAPQPVTGATRTSSYSTDVVSWTNPKDFDFHHVDVTRYGATSAETKLVYRGAGTKFTSTGLVAGRPYTYLIRAYDTHGQTATTSVRLDTLRAAPSIAATTTLTYGGSARISGVLRWNGGVLGGRTVALFAQRVGSTTWSRVASTTTTSTGTYAFSTKPAVNTRYKVGYLGSGSAGGAESATVTVGVAPSVSIAASRTQPVLRRHRHLQHHREARARRPHHRPPALERHGLGDGHQPGTVEHEHRLGHGEANRARHAPLPVDGRRAHRPPDRRLGREVRQGLLTGRRPRGSSVVSSGVGRLVHRWVGWCHTVHRP